MKEEKPKVKLTWRFIIYMIYIFITNVFVIEAILWRYNFGISIILIILLMYGYVMTLFLIKRRWLEFKGN